MGLELELELELAGACTRLVHVPGWCHAASTRCPARAPVYMHHHEARHAAHAHQRFALLRHGLARVGQLQLAVSCMLPASHSHLHRPKGRPWQGLTCIPHLHTGRMARQRKTSPFYTFL